MNNFFKDRAKDSITIEKQDGRSFVSNHATVQKDMIFIYDGNLPLEEGDIITHKLPNNTVEKFEVVDRGFHNIHLSPHFQAEVKRIGKNSDKISNSNHIIVGDNSHVNINSIDNSINIFNQNNIPFDEIREELNKIEDKNIKKESLECLDELENSKDLRSYGLNLIRLISILADVITILGPYLPKLTSVFGF